MKDIDNSDYQEWRETQIEHWQSNGLSNEEAENLIDEYENDPYTLDSDMEVPYDISILDRINEHGGFI
jgi:hypothetical protein